MHAIASLAPSVIKYPNYLSYIKRWYHEKSQMPNMISEIDGTHVKIQSPGYQNGEIYRNQKGYFSINVQAVADMKLLFRDISVRWPGSTHDSRMFENSRIKQRLMDSQLDGIIIGDAGYPLLPYLLTPLSNPTPGAQSRYNKKLSSARMCVERSFGVLKRRFPALKWEVRLRRPENICILITSAMVMHNICIMQGESAQFFDDGPEEIERTPHQHIHQDDNSRRSEEVAMGVAVRESYINLFLL